VSPQDTSELPNVAAVLAQVLQRLPLEQQPLLIAYAERLAALRYRDWATQPEVTAHRARLNECAEREEQIAGRIEGLFADGAATQRAIVASNPDLLEINRTLFAGRPLAQQFTIQANGERLGAATWRAFAQRETDASRRDVLLACAELEEASAVVLESILA